MTEHLAGDWACTFHYPERWVEVPLVPGHADPEAALPAVAGAVDATFAAEVPDRDDRRALARLVAGIVADDARRDAVVAAHRYAAGEPGSHVHAHLTAWVVGRRHPASLDAELRSLARLAAHARRPLEAPQADRVTLDGAGPAVRIRYLEVEPDGPAPGDGNGDHGDGTSGVAVDTLTYLIPVADTPDCLWLRFWTPHLAAADRLVAEFDAMAHALHIDRADRADGGDPR